MLESIQADSCEAVNRRRTREMGRPIRNGPEREPLQPHERLDGIRFPAHSARLRPYPRPGRRTPEEWTRERIHLPSGSWLPALPFGVPSPVIARRALAENIRGVPEN